MSDTGDTLTAPIFEKAFPVRYHELDWKGYVRPVTLLNYLQDAAGMHALQLGVSVQDLHRRGLTWVLSRLHLVVEQNVRANQTMLVRTWPSTRTGQFSCREFELLNAESGTCVARATTSWAVLDLRTRRPVSIDGHLPEYPLLERRAVQDDFASLPQLPGVLPITELTFRVQRADLDINRHVNNAIYAGWALEAVPDAVAAGELAELEIGFRAEALYGQTVVSSCAVAETAEASACCLHRIANLQDGRELARLRTRWRTPAGAQPLPMLEQQQSRQ